MTTTPTTPPPPTLIERCARKAIDALVMLPMNVAPGITIGHARRSRRAILNETLDWPTIVTAVLTEALVVDDDLLLAAQAAYAKSVIAGHVEGHAPLEGKLAAIEPDHMRAALLAAFTRMKGE